MNYGVTETQRTHRGDGWDFRKDRIIKPRRREDAKEATKKFILNFLRVFLRALRDFAVELCFHRPDIFVRDAMHIRRGGGLGGGQVQADVRLAQLLFIDR